MAGSVDWKQAGLESLGHFKELLKIPTVNPPGNERLAADYLARLFDQEGIPYRLVEAAQGRTNIVARLAGNGGARPILLNGHLDVVPVETARWKHPPFEAVEAEGCVWGRGALDMKNMVAMAAMTLVLLKRMGVELKRDVIFAGVADEEAGCTLGSQYLVENHPDLVDAEYVLSEAGGHTLHMGNRRIYPIQVAEKGICWFEITAGGEPGHGSMPHPDNAVVNLSRAIAQLGSTRLPIHVTPVVDNFLRAIAPGSGLPQKQLFRLLLHPTLADKILGALQAARPEEARAIGAMLSNTATPTVLVGGNKVNVIPSQASVQVDGRVLPGKTIDEFLDEVRAVVGSDVEINVFQAKEGSTFPSDTPLFGVIEAAIAHHDPGAVAVPYMVPGLTDASAYAKLGAICYGFVPLRLEKGMDFSKLYHGDDERVPREGYLWGQRVLFDVVEQFCRC